MTAQTKRMAPAGNGSHSEKNHHHVGNDANTPSIPAPPADPVSDALEGVYVVLLRLRDVEGPPRWSRRVYLSLHSAQKALARAHARDQEAHLRLCTLTVMEGGAA